MSNLHEVRPPAVIPREGLHVLHLFYKADLGSWSLLTSEEKMESRTAFLSLVKEVRDDPDSQLLVFSMVTPKADLGFMLLTKDLQYANSVEKKLSMSLGPDILVPTFSYLSLTESSEYTTTEAQHAKSLEEEDGLREGDEGFQQAMQAFRDRIAKYTRHRLYPELPDWPVACFYPMSKRRGESNNWYSLDFDARKQLMAGHARVGRKYSGKILQLITGSTGLDEMEWFVTLFAHDTAEIRNIVYEMRFDEVSAKYAEFGDFFIGLQVPIDEVFVRLQL